MLKIFKKIIKIILAPIKFQFKIQDQIIDGFNNFKYVLEKEENSKNTTE